MSSMSTESVAPSRRGRRLMAMFALALPLALPLGCGDGPTDGRAPLAGRYALVTVNESALPWTGMIGSTGATTTIEGGDLVLRADGTFGVGLTGEPGYFTLGRYTSDSVTSEGERALTLHYFIGPSAADSAHAALLTRGDSVIWTIPSAEGFPGARLAFLRTAVAPAVEGTFALTSVNGDASPPHVILDDAAGDGRFLVAVAYDTLDFHDDGVFFQQHRSEHSFHVTAEGDTSVASVMAWSTWGSYSRTPAGALVLRPFVALWERTPDTVSVAGSGTALERRWVRPGGTYTERLTRVP